MKRFTTEVLTMFIGAWMFSLFFVVPGCSTSQQAATYKATLATDAAVRTAMIGWGAYVTANHPGTNAEMQVYKAFQIYKSSAVVVLEATENLTTNTAATNAWTQAVAVEQSAQAGLISMISTLTNSAH